MASRNQRRRARRTRAKRGSDKPSLPVTPRAAEHARRDRNRRLRQAPESSAPRNDPPRVSQKEPTFTSALLGVAVGLGMAGLSDRIAVTTLPSHPSPSVITGLGLLALALGIRIPQRFAVWACLHARHRLGFSARTGDVDISLLLRSPIDRALHWTVLGVIALLAGLAMALMPVFISMCSRFWLGIYDKFVWSDPFMPVAQAAFAMACVVIPFGLLGLACSCAHHLMCRNGRWILAQQRG